MFIMPKIKIVGKMGNFIYHIECGIGEMVEKISESVHEWETSSDSE